MRQLSSEVQRYHKIQQLAYQAVTEARAKLRVGMTEIEAAKLVDDFFERQGHDLFFHRAFAWFGDRTAFKGFKRPEETMDLGSAFMPSHKKLEENMPVILDVAPSVEGHAVDIGYSFFFGEDPTHHQARVLLKEFRTLILTLAQERRAISEIYHAVEKLIRAKGFKNCHDLYPLGVLGHRIGKLPLLGLPKLNLRRFAPQSYAFLAKQSLFGSTVMKASEKRPLSTGLWAIEPHFGNDEFGVKFEEILVVEKDRVYWLDDTLPHLTEV